MKFSRSDFEMQRFESRRPSQPVRSPPPDMERPLKTARYREVSTDMGWSPCAEIGDGSASSASCLRGRILVSRFRTETARSPVGAPPPGTTGLPEPPIPWPARLDVTRPPALIRGNCSRLPYRSNKAHAIKSSVQTAIRPSTILGSRNIPRATCESPNKNSKK